MLKIVNPNFKIFAPVTLFAWVEQQIEYSERKEFETERTHNIKYDIEPYIHNPSSEQMK